MASDIKRHSGVVVGSALWDFAFEADRKPEFGDTVICDAVHKSPGGKGLNQAVALRRLGAEVQFVSAVGADSLGGELLEYCASEGLSIDTIYRAADIPTGIGVPVNVTDGGKFGFAAPGASLALSPSATAWVDQHLSDISWILCHFETNRDVLGNILASARATGITVYMNAAPLNDEFLDLVAMADIVIVNSVESRWLARSFEMKHDSPQAFVTGLRKRLGIDGVVVTSGQDGVCWATNSAEGSSKAFETEVIDPVGAGDAFCAGLVHGLEVQDLAFSDAVAFASHCAAVAVSSEGAAVGMPSYAAVAALQSRTK